MAKPKKTGHKSHDRVMEQDYQAKQRAVTTGHNSGLINPLIQEIYSGYEQIEESIKALNKDKKALRVKAKEEFGVPTRVFSIELSMRKLDPNVRAEIEIAHQDLKAMLGYQMALNFHDDNVKSEKNDPIEAARKKVTPFNKKATSKKIEAKAKKKFVTGQPIPFDDGECSE